MEKYPIAFFFSGQGSQYYQMGLPLYNADGTFRKHLKEVDTILMDKYNFSIIKKIFDQNKKKSDEFHILNDTHPSLFAIQYALAKSLCEFDIYPEILFGISLGEIVALTVSKVLDLETAVDVIIAQVQSICANVSKGKMLAILQYDINEFNQNDFFGIDCTIAGINHDLHFIVSGEENSITKLSAILNKNNIFSQILPVEYAFHSPLIDKAKNDFFCSIASSELKREQIPLYSCFKKGPIKNLSKEYLWDFGREPFFFKDTISSIEKNGPFCYIDIGPSGMGKNLLKSILNKDSSSVITSILSPFLPDDLIVNCYNTLKSGYEKQINILT